MSKFKITSVKLAIGVLLLAIAGVALARLWCPSASEQSTSQCRDLACTVVAYASNLVFHLTVELQIEINGWWVSLRPA